MDQQKQEFLTKLWSEHRAKLLGLIRRRIRTKSNAPDLVQEVYARLLKIKDTEAIRNPEGYLYKVTSNLLVEYGIREQYEVSHLSYADEWSIHAAMGVLPSLESELEAEQEAALLALALKRLPAKVRRAMTLKYEDGLTYDEIATAMRVSPSSVKKYLAKGIALCRIGTEALP